MLQASSNTLAEIQGYYGSLSIAEKVVQQLWSEQNFKCTHLTTQDGDPVEIVNPGRWNTLEGPDFKQATIKICGRKLVGDIEVHLYPEDWNRHRHRADVNYADVILHVTLFRASERFSHPTDSLVLLPYLEEDLETLVTRYFLDQTQSQDEKLPEWANTLQTIGSPKEEHLLLWEKARIRWEQKRRLATSRLKSESWKEVCHQYALEVLGYRRNRVPMHRIALEFPLGKTKEWEAETIYRKKMGQWKLRGIRPANHPLKRLKSYGDILNKELNWPEKLLELAFAHFFSRDLDHAPIDLGNLKRMRAFYEIPELNELIKKKIFQEAIGGTRIHTLCVDAVLPLISAKLNIDLFPEWYVWYLGDAPDLLLSYLQSSSIAGVKGAVCCNGWIQGLLQVGFEAEY
ncbi:MAG: DUF2851 family protein [Opitutales bacterium]|nr:DUF2851 family protein [Opitutales bacterium]